MQNIYNKKDDKEKDFYSKEPPLIAMHIHNIPKIQISCKEKEDTQKEFYSKDVHKIHEKQNSYEKKEDTEKEFYSEDASFIALDVQDFSGIQNSNEETEDTELEFYSKDTSFITLDVQNSPANSGSKDASTNEIDIGKELIIAPAYKNMLTTLENQQLEKEEKDTSKQQVEQNILSN